MDSNQLMVWESGFGKVGLLKLVWESGFGKVGYEKLFLHYLTEHISTVFRIIILETIFV